MGPVGLGFGMLVRTRKRFRTAVLQCGRSSGTRRFDAVSANTAAIPSSLPRPRTSHGGRPTRRLPLCREPDETSRSRSRRPRPGMNARLTHWVRFGAVQSPPGTTQIRRTPSQLKVGEASPPAKVLCPSVPLFLCSSVSPCVCVCVSVCVPARVTNPAIDPGHVRGLACAFFHLDSTPD